MARNDRYQAPGAPPQYDQASRSALAAPSSSEQRWEDDGGNRASFHRGRISQGEGPDVPYEAWGAWGARPDGWQRAMDESDREPGWPPSGPAADHPDPRWRSPMGGNFRVSEGFSRVPTSHRGKGPKNYTRSDEQIMHEVSQRLMDHDGIDASDIEVAIEGGDATLNGTVPTLQMKRMAGELVEDTGGVSNCQNNLRVATTGAKRLGGAARDEPRG